MDSIDEKLILKLKNDLESLLDSKFNNFGDLNQLPSIPAVYAIYTEERLIYVGSTKSLKTRMKQLSKEAEEFEIRLKNFEKDKGKEQTLQEFLENHTWFLGLYYKDFHTQKTSGMGRFDFYLKRFDGSEEIVELKRPDAKFMNADGTISAEFAKALDQLLKYFDDVIAISSSVRISKYFGISEFYPRGIIVFGYKPDNKTKEFINRWKNSLRIEILTYDQILTKIRTAIRNLEKRK